VTLAGQGEMWFNGKLRKIGLKLPNLQLHLQHMLGRVIALEVNIVTLSVEEYSLTEMRWLEPFQASFPLNEQTLPVEDFVSIPGKGCCWDSEGEICPLEIKRRQSR